VNHVADSTLRNGTEVKDKEEPLEIAASTSMAPNFSHDREEEDDPWDDTWVRDIATAELKQSVNIVSCSLAEAWKLRKELDPNGLGKDYNTV
jgi:hypothetical protein